MNYVKSVLAALFVAEFAYVLAVIAFAAIDSGGVRKNAAIGAGAWATYALHPVTFVTALVIFVLALVLFLRT